MFLPRVSCVLSGMLPYQSYTSGNMHEVVSIPGKNNISDDSFEKFKAQLAFESWHPSELREGNRSRLTVCPSSANMR